MKRAVGEILYIGGLMVWVLVYWPTVALILAFEWLGDCYREAARAHERRRRVAITGLVVGLALALATPAAATILYDGAAAISGAWYYDLTRVEDGETASGSGTFEGLGTLRIDDDNFLVVSAVAFTLPGVAAELAHDPFPEYPPRLAGSFTITPDGVPPLGGLAYGAVLHEPDFLSALFSGALVEFWTGEGNGGWLGWRGQVNVDGVAVAVVPPAPQTAVPEPGLAWLPLVAVALMTARALWPR